MYFLNGVIAGGDRSDSPGDGGYATARRIFRRLVYHWLTKVVGWSDVDKSGTKWDQAPIDSGTDGATDAVDSEIFNSAGADFTVINPVDSTKRYYATITGFSNPERDGMYMVQRIESTTQFRISKAHCGAHTDGFLLGETGLTWRIDEWKDNDGRPAIGDWFVLGGTGAGGTFHMRCVGDNSPSYSPDKFDISPFDDWDAVAHAWKTPARYTSQQGNLTEPWMDSALVFGVADLTHAVFWVRYYTYDIVTGSLYPNTYYFGDINPFRPIVDTNPVVCIARQTSGDWNEWSGFYNNVGMIGADGTPTTGRILWPSLHGSSTTHFADGLSKVYSEYSGRVFRHPLIVACYDASFHEVRGTLKSLEGFHHYGDRICTPFGTNRDRLRLQFSCLPWNGSKQFRYVF